ncbi:unnamed protein product, partial [Ectocarpus sp. 13 AM-2016]
MATPTTRWSRSRERSSSSPACSPTGHRRCSSSTPRSSAWPASTTSTSRSLWGRGGCCSSATGSGTASRTPSSARGSRALGAPSPNAGRVQEPEPFPEDQPLPGVLVHRPKGQADAHPGQAQAGDERRGGGSGGGSGGNGGSVWGCSERWWR